MIREKLLALREQRAQLVAKAETQRDSLQVLIARAERATLWFDQGRALLGRLLAHPVWIAGGIALFVALRPRKALKWFATGIYVWRNWKSLRTWLERFSPRQRAGGV